MHYWPIPNVDDADSTAPEKDVLETHKSKPNPSETQASVVPSIPIEQQQCELLPPPSVTDSFSCSQYQKVPILSTQQKCNPFDQTHFQSYKNNVFPPFTQWPSLPQGSFYFNKLTGHWIETSPLQSSVLPIISRPPSHNTRLRHHSRWLRIIIVIFHIQKKFASCTHLYTFTCLLLHFSL